MSTPTANSGASSGKGLFSTYGWNGSYWQEKSILATGKDTLSTATRMMEHPEPFFEGMTRGVMRGMAGEKTDEKGSSLFDRVSQMVIEGVSSASAALLEQLLENSEAYDVEERDAHIKERALEDLKQAQAEKKGVKETAKKVWEALTNYHILVGGVVANNKASSHEGMREMRTEVEGKQCDGVSPIHTLVRCQEEFRTLRLRHELPIAPRVAESETSELVSEEPKVSESDMEKVRNLEEATNQMIKSFSAKTIDLATMYFLRVIFNRKEDPATYLKIIEEGGNTEENYLREFTNGRVQRFCYKIVYKLIAWLIRPIIAQTIEQMVVQLRTFLKSDVALLNVIEIKIEDMANYYGLIEKARRDYLESHREDEAGTFKRYLKESIKIYDGKYTKADLMKIFEAYIVENFVPRPSAHICGHRIPLISYILEEISYALRKAIVRRVMKKIMLMENLLTQGPGAVHHAQLGLKHLFEQKLTQISTMIDRSRVNSDDPLKSDEQLSAKQKLQAKKAQIITRQLRKAIQLHSQTLLRFIAIESCNGDERRLRNLDNSVTTLVSDALRAIADLVIWEPPSLDKILEDASTDVLETALVALFEDKEGQVEKHLQTIFGVLDKSFTYVPEEKRREKEFRYRKECTVVDRNLTTLQEKLTRSAVYAALESHLKNASRKRHKDIKAYVQTEQERFSQFIEELHSCSTTLNSMGESYRYDASKPESSMLKIQLGATLSLIEDYLGHISNQLCNTELEQCYGDVQGDLHNIYAGVIGILSTLRESIEALATAADLIGSHEQELICTEKLQQILRDSFTPKLSSEEAKKLCASLEEQAPHSVQEEIKSILSSVTSQWDLYKKASQALKTHNKIENSARIEQKMRELAEFARRYYELRGKPLNGANTKEKEHLNTEISSLYTELMKTNDKQFKKHIIPLLQAKDTDKLYQILHVSKGRGRIPVIFVTLEKITAATQKTTE